MYILQSKKFIVIVLVCLLLLVGLFVVLNDYSAKNKAKREELEEIYQLLYEQEMIKIEQNEIQREEEKKEHAIKEATYSPYQKLSDKTMLTSVFYLGDRNAYGKGLKNTNLSWKSLLKDKYTAFPGVSFRIEGTQNAEKPTGGTFVYLGRLFEAYRIAYKLDLMFLCIGTNGEEEDFGAKYEELVRIAKNVNRNCDVICIIEHNQIDSEAEAILSICEHYELTCVDMRPHFEGKEGLTFEDGYPNEQGHQLYSEVIFETLKRAVDEKIGPKEYKTEGLFLTSEDIKQIEERQ